MPTRTPCGDAQESCSLRCERSLDVTRGKTVCELRRTGLGNSPRTIPSALRAVPASIELKRGECDFVRLLPVDTGEHRLSRAKLSKPSKIASNCSDVRFWKRVATDKGSAQRWSKRTNAPRMVPYYTGVCRKECATYHGVGSGYSMRQDEVCHRKRETSEQRNQEAQDSANDIWYGAQEAARFLGLHRSTLHLAIQRERLTPDWYTPGGHARFRRTTLEAFQRLLADEAATSDTNIAAPTQTLARLAHMIASGQPLRPICDAAVRGIGEALPGLMSCIVFRSSATDDPGNVHVYTSHGFPRRFFRIFALLRQQPQASFATFTVLRTQAAEYCEDITARSEEPSYSGTIRLFEEVGLHSYAVTPIVVDGQSIGVMVMGSAKPYRFSAHVRTFLQGVADSIATTQRLLNAHQFDATSGAARESLSQALALRAARGMVSETTQSRIAATAAVSVTPSSALEKSREHDQKTDLAPLATRLLQRTGAMEVCALGFGVGVQLDSHHEPLLDLACKAAGSETPIKRHWRTGGAMYSGLGISVPLPSGLRGAVAARWLGMRAMSESDHLLLMAFATACALLS